VSSMQGTIALTSVVEEEVEEEEEGIEAGVGAAVAAGTGGTAAVAGAETEGTGREAGAAAEGEESAAGATAGTIGADVTALIVPSPATRRSRGSRNKEKEHPLIGSSIRASRVIASYRGSIIIMEKDGFPAVSRRERAGARFGS